MFHLERFQYLLSKDSEFQSAAFSNSVAGAMRSRISIVASLGHDRELIYRTVKWPLTPSSVCQKWIEKKSGKH
jgi:hypothetical protein